jgi:sugar lactone lactonase YvrE
MEPSVPSIVVGGLTFTENPRWRDGRLWFSDRNTVKTVDPTGQVEVMATVPDGVSGLGFLPDGSLLVVASHQRHLLRLTDDGLEPVADLSSFEPVHSADMVVDSRGRAYIGGFGFDLAGGEPEKPANIVLVTPEGDARLAAEDVRFPNGMAITADGSTLIVAESFAQRLLAFRILPDGSLTDRRVFAQLEEELPDGICVDEAGAVWVTSPWTGVLLRVRDGGTIADRIPLHERCGRYPYACVLGGPDRRTLFLCTQTWSCAGVRPGLPRTGARRATDEAFIEKLPAAIPGAGFP